MSKKCASKKEYRAYLSSRNIRLVSFAYVSSVHVCLICKHKWSARPANVIRNKSGCKTCSNRNKSECIRKAAEKRYLKVCKTKKLKLLESYTTALSPIKHKCLICDNAWTVKPNDILNSAKESNRCPNCANVKASARMRMSEKEMRKRIEDNGRVTVLSFHIRETNKRQKVKVQCRICGFKFNACTHDLIFNKSGCSGPCKLYASAKNLSKVKTYTLGKDKILVQGYEPFALDWIQEKGIKPKEIRAGAKSEIPVIKYWLKGKDRKYYPDIFIPKLNRVVEVKSTYTVGLTNYDWFRKNREKARASIRAGFDYRLFVFSVKGKKLKVPEKWHELTHKKFCQRFYEINGHVI